MKAGDAIPELVRRPTAAQVFQFSAVTWNAHRIHYDLEHAREEGFSGVVVQAHLHGCFLAQAALAASGDGARLERLSWQNRGPAFVGDTLTVTGLVTGAGPARMELELEERNQRGELCVKGRATVAMPNQDAADDDAR